MKKGRLILSGPMSAAANMALDRALFCRFLPGLEGPIVRLYRWSPPSFSIGRSQDPDILLNTDNFVRRPTGGGLLYHDDELTYALILSPRDLEKAGNVKTTFRRITGFLIRAYRKLGLNASFADETPGRVSPGASIAPVCFGRHEDLDIVVNGKKIGGNAQKRGRDRILQHGSIPLSVNAAAYKAALKDPGLLDLSGVTSLEEETRRRIGYNELQKVLIEAIEEHFSLTLTPEDPHGTPTPLA